MEVSGEINSDHQWVTVWLGGKGESEKKKKEEWIKRVNQSEETRRKFRERTERIKLGKGGVDKELEKLITRIKEDVRVKR